MQSTTHQSMPADDAGDGNCGGATITATSVPEAERLDALPCYFGTWFLRAEGLVFNWMHELCAAYDGGTWEFKRLSNCGFFMAPDGWEPLRVVVETNGYEGLMSTEAAGITACLFAYCHLANTEGREQERFVELFHALRAFACEHAEAGAISRAID